MATPPSIYEDAIAISSQPIRRAHVLLSWFCRFSLYYLKWETLFPLLASLGIHEIFTC